MDHNYIILFATCINELGCVSSMYNHLVGCSLSMLILNCKVYNDDTNLLVQHKDNDKVSCKSEDDI